MTVTREDLNPSTVKLTVTCDSKEVSGAFDRALKKISKEVRIPGFRPGHAPKSMVEGMVDPNRLAEDAADLLVRQTFPKAIENEGLQPDPGTRPSVALEEIDREEGVGVYTVKVPLPPRIALGEYRGVEVDAPDLDVTDEEIEFQIDELRKRKGTREVVVGRGLQEGDNAVVNIKLDDEETGDGKNFLTVVGRTFEGLDAAITGMNTEEIKSVELTFPEGFGDPSWANTTRKVHLAISSASTVRMPELSDELAQEFQAENVDTLKERVRESIARAKEQLGREMMQEQILERLRTTSEISVSDNMWEALATQRLTEIAEEQAKAGKSLEAYAEENGMTLEGLITSWNEQAKIHVERAMVVRDIFEKEGLQLTNSDLNTELLFMSQEYGMEPQALLTQLQSSNALPELQFRGISRKVTDFLLANAKVEGTPIEAPDAPTLADPVRAEDAPVEDASAEGVSDVPGDAPKPKKPRAKKATATEADDKPEEAIPGEAIPEEATPVTASDSPEEAGGGAVTASADESPAPESEGGDEMKDDPQS